MDTAKLKKFAQESRKELMNVVSAKLEFVLVTDSLARRESKSSVEALEGLIKEIGKDEVVEKVAYTWFNRFCALRFMDANRYTKIGIVSPIEGQTQPEILAEAKMNYIDESVVSSENMTKIRNLLNGSMTSNDAQGEAYKLLLVSYCNYYNKQLPFMFESINNYTELLLPDDLLSQSSVLTKALDVLDNETCKNVEVIGWLYQYYISEKKDEVFAELKKGKKISKENVPAATQIFTPKWIVSYMVENSVGKMWLESHPDERLQSQLKYYLEPAEQEAEVQNKLNEIINKNLKPQDIKVLDPACGSGHILVTAFSTLFEIYKSQGWQENEIPEMILKNNLYGLDICDRAAQLSQFAVMMKAREYDRSIFDKVHNLNICSIKDTNWMETYITDELYNKAPNKEIAKEQIALLQDTFKDAKEYGSILDVKGIDFDFWHECLKAFNQQGQISTYAPIIKGRLPFTLKQAKIMQQKYECVLSNPPYMGNKGMSPKLSEFVKKNFNNTKTDFFSVFMEKNYYYTIDNGYTSMITQPSWLFLSSFEKLRNDILANQNIMSVLHMGRGIFGIDFGSCAFTLRKSTIKKYIGSYFRLHQRTFQYINPEDIENLYLTAKADHGFKFDFSSYKANSTEMENNSEDDENIEHTALKIYFNAKQTDFDSIPSSPIAYWASDRVREIFKTSSSLSELTIVRNGMKTGDNDTFLRFWNEIDFKKFDSQIDSYESAQNSSIKWFPYNKGGEYRKWYGNNEYVVNWENCGNAIFNNAKIDKRNVQDYPSHLKFSPSISWSLISSGAPSFRYKEHNLSDIAGMSCWYLNDINILLYLLGFSNSILAHRILKLLAPTINYQAGDIGRLPIIIDENKVNKVVEIVRSCLNIEKEDWDSFETSWDFELHPLLKFKQNNKVQDSFNGWQEYTEQQFNQLKANEEELNRLFLEIYGLQDEMPPDVSDKDLSYFKKADELREVKSLLSYAVGCMFGRYSLDEKGLVFAGGEFDKSKYKTLEADEDAVIPVLSEHLFSDDITSRFKDFLRAAFGNDNFDENLEYVANVLGKKNTDTADDTIRNYFLKDFYNDHVKMYQKRPIYWMFSSGKGNFNALVYMHRYNKDTASVILNSYLRNYRDEKLAAKIANCKKTELSTSTSQSDKIKAQKDCEIMEKIVIEVSDYERDILYPLATERKEIDLDNGVKANYLEFGKALKDIGLKAK